jgi:hypothetical protein
MMNCTEFEVLLADFMDGELSAPGREREREEFVRHLQTCETCAAMEKDVRSAMSFMELAADAEPPRELVGKILHATNSGWEFKLKGQGIRGWINRLLAPVLKPRFVMGAMLTIMSLTMLTRCAGSKNTMTAADLDPVRLWMSLDTRGHRVWERAVKGYESMRLVYEIRNQISDWNQQQAAEEEAAADAKANSRKLTLPGTGQGPSQGQTPDHSVNQTGKQPVTQQQQPEKKP